MENTSKQNKILISNKHNKDIYQWKTHKHKLINSWNKKHIKQKNILPLTWISQQIKAKVARAKKVKYNVKHLNTI